VIKKPRKGGG